MEARRTAQGAVPQAIRAGVVVEMGSHTAATVEAGASQEERRRRPEGRPQRGRRESKWGGFKIGRVEASGLLSAGHSSSAPISEGQKPQGDIVFPVGKIVAASHPRQ